MTPLKVGLLVDDEFCDSYVQELIRWARSGSAVEIRYRIVVDGRRRTGALWRLLEAFEALLLRGYRQHAEHFRPRDLSRLVPGRKGAAAVRDLGLDLLIRCGGAPPSDELAGAARLGMLSLESGGAPLTAGSVPFFRECLEERPRGAFEIRHLSGGARPGSLLLRGAYPTQYLYGLNQARAMKKAYAHLRRILETTAALGRLPAARDAAAGPEAAASPPPGAPAIAAYALLATQRLLVKSARFVLGIKKRWGISMQAGGWSALDFSRSSAIKNPRGRMWADPFLWTEGGRTACFVEELVYGEKGAHISALDIRDGAATDLGVALREPFHQSFPFLFRHGGRLYMCPESSAARQIRFYRCAEFPLKWELHHVAMEGVAAADTMVFEKHGRWWMLTNIDESGLDDFNSELYLFSADSPFASRWTPHPLNPLKIDAEGGRNAGLIIEGDRVFRLGQRQAFDLYGAGMLVHEIVELSETSYAEKVVGRLDADFGPNIIGTHHMTSDGKTTVIDRCALELTS